MFKSNDKHTKSGKHIKQKMRRRGQSPEDTP